MSNQDNFPTPNAQELLEQLQLASLPEFVTKIHEPVFTAKQIPMTQRLISTWHDKDLFLYKQELGQWRRFSMADYIWVLLLLRLRKWSLSLDVIQQVRNICVESTFDLFEQQTILRIAQLEPGIVFGDDKEAIELFENRGQLQEDLARPEFQKFSLWLNMVIRENADILLRIIPGREPIADFVTLNKYTEHEAILAAVAEKGGIFIGFKSLLAEFYQDSKLKWEEHVPLDLNEKEKQIIRTLREKNLKRVVIHLVNDKPTRMEKKHKQKTMTPTEAINLLTQRDYTHVETDKEEGDTLYVNLTEKIKL